MQHAAKMTTGFAVAAQLQDALTKKYRISHDVNLTLIKEVATNLPMFCR